LKKENLKMPVLADLEVDIDIDKVLRGMGGDPAQLRARRPQLVEIAEWAIEEGRMLLEPAASYSQYIVHSLSHERLSLGDKRFLSGPLITEHLAPTREIAAILCTIGGNLEEVVSQLILEDPIRGLALDGLGNAAIEILANKICSILDEQAQESGFSTTIPLSPGMIGWPVEVGQRQIFSLVDGSSIGLSLEESLMMRPRKSISMVVGIGEALGVKSRTCDYCSLKETCRYQDHYA
jgi:hypothetical protein